MQLIHDKGKHNKFWSYEIDEQSNDVTIRWGRLGTKGQEKIYKFPSKYQAEDFAWKKTNEKKRKGYAEVEEDTFDLKQLQAELVGAGCKIEELVFVRKLNDEKDKKLYKVLRDAADLADPTYVPLIYCSLKFTGKRGVQQILIDPDAVYSCWQIGNLQISGGWTGKSQEIAYRLDEVEEITEAASPEMKKIRDKAPALVAALIR